MSKGLHMIGWRIGWVCGNERIVRSFADVKDNCDSGQFIAIQKAAAAALDDPEIPRQVRTKYQRRLRKLVDVLARCGFEARMPGGTYFLYVPAPKGAAGGPLLRQRRGRPASTSSPSTRSAPCPGTTPARSSASRSPTRPPTKTPKTRSWPKPSPDSAGCTWSSDRRTPQGPNAARVPSMKPGLSLAGRLAKLLDQLAKRERRHAHEAEIVHKPIAEALRASPHRPRDRAAQRHRQ